MLERGLGPNCNMLWLPSQPITAHSSRLFLGLEPEAIAARMVDFLAETMPFFTLQRTLTR